MADRGGKAMRIVVGVMLMAAFVFVAFGLLLRYAGGWGVPYFSWTTPRGSECTNNFTGYTCDALTLADVTYYSSADAWSMPAGTTVTTSSYRATHDYTLTASLTVPKTQSGAALKALTDEFGSCSTTAASPLNTKGLTAVCTMTNGDAVTQSGEPPSRLWTVGTAVRADGVRLVDLTVRSR